MASEGRREEGRGKSLLPLPSFLALLAACTITPLMNRIAVGEEPFVIAVGEGRDGATDLFAASAGGGPFHRLTYNRRVESHPVIAPSGTAVLFLAGWMDGSEARTVVVLSLLTNAERTLGLPATAAPAERAGWRGDSIVVVRTRDGSTYAVAAPPLDSPAVLLTGTARLRADSSLTVLLGDPPFATAEPCEGGLCVRVNRDSVAPLEPGAFGAVRWGADSVGYFTASGFQVRPLGPGRERRPPWTAAPGGLREITYHPGG